jgi:hypothetical protein
VKKRIFCIDPCSRIPVLKQTRPRLPRQQLLLCFIDGAAGCFFCFNTGPKT